MRSIKEFFEKSKISLDLIKGLIQNENYLRDKFSSIKNDTVIKGACIKYLEHVDLFNKSNNRIELEIKLDLNHSYLYVFNPQDTDIKAIEYQAVYIDVIPTPLSKNTFIIFLPDDLHFNFGKHYSYSITNYQIYKKLYPKNINSILNILENIFSDNTPIAIQLLQSKQELISRKYYRLIQYSYNESNNKLNLIFERIDDNIPVYFDVPKIVIDIDEGKLYIHQIKINDKLNIFTAVSKILLQPENSISINKRQELKINYHELLLLNRENITNDLEILPAVIDTSLIYNKFSNIIDQIYDTVHFDFTSTVTYWLTNIPIVTGISAKLGIQILFNYKGTLKVYAKQVSNNTITTIVSKLINQNVSKDSQKSIQYKSPFNPEFQMHKHIYIGLPFLYID